MRDATDIQPPPRPRGRKRVWSAAFLTSILSAGLAFGGLMKPSTAGLSASDIDVSVQAIPGFDKSNASVKTFGKLEWRGGLVVSSSAKNFGGWSGLAIDADGQNYFAVSDAGAWLAANLVYRDGALAGIGTARLGAIRAKDGSNLKKNRDRDAEAVALASGTLAKGTLYMAFEHNDRIGEFRFDGQDLASPASYLPMPAETKSMRRDGLEALTVLKGGPRAGSLVGFAEHPLKREKDYAGWIWTGGKPQRLSVESQGKFGITDAASLPDGGLVILERSFNWSEGVRMRLRRFAAADIKPGAVLKGDVLLDAGLEHEIDNMEGLAIHTDATGETRLTLISDDNFNWLIQRTIMLQFALPPAIAREVRK